ncbi:MULTISPECIES: IclR family transcriptional regulator [Kaistia]|uniref:IclR family transcriptional regulator n=1 Tax=Kaistia nematophila TaxID=2994654 RepID=A0A9X3ILH2_9HYPH|nr:IclR family transcriptional regulator [Kaistia nematophila]MCX5569852.1 IclR family transcriptional regulator [Kaistia nematophila]
MNSIADSDRYSIRAVDRAIDVIQCLAASDSALTADEIAAAIGLPKSTVFRVLATLLGRGLLDRDPERQTFRFGTLALLVGVRALGDLDVKRVARPIIEQLAEATGETVHLSVLNERSALCIDKIDSKRAVRMSSYVGFRDPLHCSGVGKILLAFQDEAAREALIERIGFEKHTERTITDPAALRAHLRQIVALGHAVDHEEIEDGLSCVAAPVRDHTGKVVAAISNSGPTYRLDEAAMRDLVGVVREHAARISAALGYLARKPAR